MFYLPFFEDSSKYKDVEVGQTPKELIYTDNKLSFYRYKPVKDNLHPTPFLIIYALINKNYILDLVPGTSFVEYLVNEGFDTYIIDWGEPGDEDRFLELDYFIDWYIHKAVKKTLEISGADKLTMFGYCMGGHLSTIYTALHSELIKNLIVLATPIDTASSHFIDTWTNKENLNIDKLVDAFGNVPAKIMQRIFGIIRDNMEKNYKGDIEAQDAIAKWSKDNINIAGEAFRKYVKDIFQKNKLCNNKMIINDKKVELNKIISNLMIITGEDDWVAPYKATTALKNLVSSNIKKIELINGGHLGFVVKKNSKKVWGKITKWLTEVENKTLPNAKSAKKLEKNIKTTGNNSNQSKKSSKPIKNSQTEKLSKTK